jgi:hypothetical protein
MMSRATDEAAHLLLLRIGDLCAAAGLGSHGR